ncbi:hypothetical protein B5F10_20005 [Anaerotruncus colihominis]|uniref:MucBP domain-containing protein n=1 Tax=Anaerotruncus colihominis TaxID=169435 RepID=UPI000B370710|nr:MucBP domain-containing protein [Anaerotruncus colihominis]OUP69382.1 hypothetical protein B5F10_20005 [Anaerotruncus colihominis]
MKRWKRFLASVCAAVCAAGFSLPAFAADLSPTWFDTAVKAMPYIEGSDGEYLFSPPDEIFDDNSRSIWQQIKEDFNDDSRVVLVGFYLPAVGDRLGIAFQSHDKATLKLEKFSTSSHLVYYYDSSDALFCSFLNSPTQGGISVFQAYAFSNNKQMLTTTYLTNPRQPMIWSNQTGIQLPPSSDVAFASDIKNIVFEAPPTPAKHTLTIQYQYEDGSQAAEPAIRSLAAGDSYEVVSPVLSGYAADKPTVSGTMPDNDLTITITYTAIPPTPAEHTLTIQYQYEDGSQAAEPAIRSLAAGDSYEVVSPVLSDYTADKPTVSGMMPDSDLTITVIYAKSSGGTGSDDPWDISPGTDWSSPFEWYDISLNATWGSPFNWFDIAPDTQWHSTFPWS